MTTTDLNGVVRIIESLEWFPEASRPTGVLVASRDLDTRLVLANHLENHGYSVWTVGSGADAYQTGVEHPVGIDMLICDEGISDLPAPELYARLKARIPGLRCCVLATTPQRTRASEAARLGAAVLDVAGRGCLAEEEHEVAAAHV
jgi:DNA-binding NtrC family response regulator